MKQKEFWVFTITGGKRFALNVKGNPTQTHDGGTTVMRFLCSAGEAESTFGIIEKYGGKVKSHNPRESEEQKEMRANMLSISGDDAVFPCELCPKCSWFDPYLPGLCGAGRAYNSVLSWEPKVLESMLEEPKHKKDYDACPIPLT
jgi:hypothetical protein